MAILKRRALLILLAFGLLVALDDSYAVAAREGGTARQPKTMGSKPQNKRPRPQKTEHEDQR
jgi:hypothetical protein